MLLNPSALIYLWIPLSAAAAGIAGIYFSAKLLTRVFPRGFKKERFNGGRSAALLAVLILSLLLCVIALARPSWKQSETTVTRKGRDVVFVVDVSRSMLAEDLYPNRLSRAKLAITDALSVMENDRVALVAFGGTAVVKCPLTLDYSFFRQAVEELSPNAVSVGGSMIGDALRKTLTEVLSGTGGFKDVILITDGEDQESYPIKAAAMLGEKDVRLIAVGLGDEDTGKRIPVTDENGNRVFLTYEGQEIWSRLDAGTLRQMTAETPGGQYLNVATGTFNMGEIYSALIKTQEKRFIDEETTVEKEENFQYFLIPAIILLYIYLFGRYGYIPRRLRK